MSPTFAMIDGVNRELKSWPVMVDGVQRGLSVMNAEIDGVQREIFSNKTVWERYSIEQVFERYQYAKSSNVPTSLRMTSGKKLYLYDNFEFDEATGEFTLSGNMYLITASSDTDENKSQMADAVNGSLSNGSGDLYYKGVLGTSSKDCGTTIYMHNGGSYGSGYMTVAGYPYVSEAVYSQKQGEYIDTVESDDPSTYPDNGISGDFWYIKVST